MGTGLPSHLAKAGRGRACMAAHLAEAEDHRQSAGQYPDYGEHHEGTALMNRGLLQVAARGDGWEGLRIDDPTAATELMDELSLPSLATSSFNRASERATSVSPDS